MRAAITTICILCMHTNDAGACCVHAWARTYIRARVWGCLLTEAHAGVCTNGA